MRKNAVFILLSIILIILSACSQDEEVIQNKLDDGQIGVIANNNRVYYRENKAIEILENDKLIFKTNDFVSYPAISPDKERIAYISPFLWEEIGDLYIYNDQKQNASVLLQGSNLENQMAFKDIAWLNDKYILAIIGYAYGTVNMGGDLYLIDTTTKETYLVKKAEELSEIINVKVEDKKVLLDVAKWKDHQMKEYFIESEEYNEKEIMKMAGL